MQVKTKEISFCVQYKRSQQCQVWSRKLLLSPSGGKLVQDFGPLHVVVYIPNLNSTYSKCLSYETLSLCVQMYMAPLLWKPIIENNQISTNMRLEEQIIVCFYKGIRPRNKSECPSAMSVGLDKYHKCNAL